MLLRIRSRKQRKEREKITGKQVVDKFLSFPLFSVLFLLLSFQIVEFMLDHMCPFILLHIYLIIFLLLFLCVQSTRERYLILNNSPLWLSMSVLGYESYERDINLDKFQWKNGVKFLRDNVVGPQCNLIQ